MTLGLTWNPLKHGNFFTSSLDGKIKSWTVDPDEKIKLVGVIDSMEQPICGLTLSPNYLFLIAVSREEKSSILHFIPIYQPNSVANDLAQLIQGKKISYPFSYWDICLMLNHEGDSLEEFYQIFSQSLSQPSSQDAPIPIENLQFLYGIHTCLKEVCPKEFPKYSKPGTFVTLRLEERIIFETLHYLEQIEPSSSQKLQLQLTLDWISLNGSFCHPSLQELAEKLSSKIFNQSLKNRSIEPRENCLFCSERVSLLDSGCPKKHLLERCGKTFLLLSGKKSNETLRCNTCGRSFLRLSQNDSLCTYCGSSLRCVSLFK